MKILLSAFLISSSIFFQISSVSAKHLKVTTYNLGLAHTFVPLSAERLPFLVSKISKSTSDVICMQEVWTREDRKFILTKLAKQYPYFHKTKIIQKHSKKHPTCNISDVFGKGKFFNCMTIDCKGTSGDDFTDCIVKKCRGILGTLKDKNPECARGVLAQVGKSTFKALYAIFNPFKGAGLFSYEGSDGLMILSKRKLRNSRIIEMEDISTTSRRRVLVSDIMVNNKKSVVTCTHLTANLSRTVPYAGEFKGWGGENLEQVKRIIKKTENITDPLIMAGDYNCSLRDDNRGIKDEFSKSCELFLNNGYEDHYVKAVRECTYCESNTLVKKSKNGKSDFILDHIFTKNIQAIDANLIFDEHVTVKKDGKPIKTNLSDHFGIELNLEF